MLPDGIRKKVRSHSGRILLLFHKQAKRCAVPSNSGFKSIPVILYLCPFLLVVVVATSLILKLHISYSLPTRFGFRDNDIGFDYIFSNFSPSTSYVGGPVAASNANGDRIILYNATRIAMARAKWGRRFVDGALSKELWNRVKDDVVVGVKTGHEVAAQRLLKLRTSGWWSVGRDVPNMLVVGDQDDDALGIVGLRSYGIELLSADNATGLSVMPRHWFDKSGWHGDKDKNLPAFHLLRSVFPGKKWYILLDDDTYIFLDNFARYISEDGLDERPIYTGKVFFIARCGGFGHDGSLLANKAEKGLFAHGGSGIILNHHAMNAMYTSVPTCMREYSSCWAGDMQVGLCLRRHNIRVRRIGARKLLERHFIPFCPSKGLSDRRYSSRWKSMEEPITFHKIPDAEQRLVSQFEKLTIRRHRPVSYRPLREFLLEHGILPAHTPHDQKTKFYSREFMPKHMEGP